MESFKAGDRVRAVSDLAYPFADHEGVIHQVQPNDRAIESMDRHIVEFSRRERHSFHRPELCHVRRAK
jgi:hypothetical protein